MFEQAHQDKKIEFDYMDHNSIQQMAKILKPEQDNV